MMPAMTEQTPAAQPPPPAAAAAQGADDSEDRGAWGRVLDVAGIIAGVLLVVIIADIWTDGRLISRRLMRARGDAGQPEQQPTDAPQ